MKTPCESSVPPSAARRTGRALAGWLLLFMLGFVSAASATDVVFSSGGYSFSAYIVTLSMDNIDNQSDYGSGSLRMELWAFDSPYTGAAGAILNGFKLAASPSLGALNADSFFTTSPIVQTALFTGLPPDGSYYVTLFLTEDQGSGVDDGFVSVAYVNFPLQLNVNEAGVSNGSYFGFSTAVSVGSGYFYDSDLGYIYPFIDGWIYDSTLNKFFYVSFGGDFAKGVYLYDLARSSWTYTQQSFWPYVYYFDGTGWVSTGFN